MIKAYILLIYLLLQQVGIDRGDIPDLSQVDCFAHFHACLFWAFIIEDLGVITNAFMCLNEKVLNIYFHSLTPSQQAISSSFVSQLMVTQTLVKNSILK